MKTRRFFLYSAVYVALVGILVYSLNSSQYTLEILGYSLAMPIAAWFMLPVGIFALLALFHMIYHAIGFYSFKRALKKDAVLYEGLVKEVLLGLDTNKDFKTDAYKIPAQIARVLSPWDKYKDMGIDSAELGGILQVIKSVKNGEIAELKKFKLPKDNPLNLQNELNKIEKSPNFYLEILKSGGEQDGKLMSAAYEKLIREAPFSEIKKLNLQLSAQDIMQILRRFVNDEIDVSADEIYVLLDDAKISKEQYLSAAVMLKNKLKPDAFLSIFEKLKSIHADADEAYVYALYELAMIDQVREAISGSDADEFMQVKTLLFLRDHGRATPTSLFFK